MSRLALLLLFACNGTASTAPTGGGDADTDTDSDTDTDTDTDTDADTDVPTPEPFAFFSPNFTEGELVPTAYTCDAPAGWQSQHNPELVWSNPPTGTEAFVVIFDDPTAGNFPHWAFYTTDAVPMGIPENVSNTAGMPAGIVELVSASRVGYTPNCPGGNTNNYRWRIWAVDTADLGVDANSSFEELRVAAVANSLERITFRIESNAGGI